MTKDLDQTQVDLGDDLLQTQTAIKARDLKTKSSRTYQDALVLFNAEMWEESKKVLRELLIRQQEVESAKSLLHKIQKIEIDQQLKIHSQPSQSTLKNSTTDRNDFLELEKKLLNDLNLLPETDALESSLIESLKGKTISIDLAIGLIQMELYEAALLCLSQLQSKNETVEDATSLKARVLAMTQKYDLALIELDPLLMSTEIEPLQKIEWIYTKATCLYYLKKMDESLVWFKMVEQLDTSYRDTQEMIRLCEKALSSSS